MHQKATGELDPTGWCTASSTEGSFSVRLPNVYNDSTISWKAGEGDEAKLCIVGTVDEKGVKFTALQTKRPGFQSSQDPLADFPTQFERQGVLRRKERITLGKLDGIEVHVGERTTSALFRVFKGRESLYQLIVEAQPPVRLSVSDPDVQQFFGSFSVPEAAGK